MIKLYDYLCFQWEKLISDLGGAFGLWIGWSIVTLLEFVELVADFVVLAVMKCSRDNRNKKTNHRIAVKPSDDKKIKMTPDTKKMGMNTPFVPPQEPETYVAPPKYASLLTRTASNTTPMKHSSYSGVTALGSPDSGNVTPTDVNFDRSRSSSQQTMRSNSTGYTSVSGCSSTSETSYTKKRKTHPLFFV